MGNRTAVDDCSKELNSKLCKLLAHDFKNPISALSANLSFLSRALVDQSEDLRGAVFDSILAADMLLRFTDNFQLIARMENNEKMEISEGALNAFVAASVHRCKTGADSAGARIEIKTPIPKVNYCWQQRYAELALENLIMSAIRHSPKGGKIIIAASQIKSEIHIAVQDQGPPLAKEVAGTLFTRQGQAEAKNHPKSRYGRGLGFLAVGLAAEALGGRVEVGVTDDQLTEFRLVLPPNAV